MLWYDRFRPTQAPKFLNEASGVARLKGSRSTYATYSVSTGAQEIRSLEPISETCFAVTLMSAGENALEPRGLPRVTLRSCPRIERRARKARRGGWNLEDLPRVTLRSCPGVERTARRDERASDHEGQERHDNPRARSPAERAAKRQGPRQHKHVAALGFALARPLTFRSRPAPPAAVARVTSACSAGSAFQPLSSFVFFVSSSWLREEPLRDGTLSP